MPFFDEKYFYESFFNAIITNPLQKTLKNLLKSCFYRVKAILSYIYPMHRPYIYARCMPDACALCICPMCTHYIYRIHMPSNTPLPYIYTKG